VVGRPAQGPGPEEGHAPRGAEREVRAADGYPMSRTPGRRKSDSSPADTHLPSPGRRPSWRSCEGGAAGEERSTRLLGARPNSAWGTDGRSTREPVDDSHLMLGGLRITGAVAVNCAPTWRVTGHKPESIPGHMGKDRSGSSLAPSCPGKCPCHPPGGGARSNRCHICRRPQLSPSMP
jgi:hypothetical protein